jgi:L-lactate dehydrogenase complex protein LldG
MEEARELNGLVVSRVKDWDEARSRLTRMLVERGVKAITLAGKDLDPKNPAWKKWDVATDRAAMEKAELGLVQADYGLAETGSIVLIASKDKPRSASLLPPTCYFALPVSAMLDSMAQLMGILEERHRQGEMPATVNVVTGPSRTADIELSLTVGVHGPGEVHVVLVG